MPTATSVQVPLLPPLLLLDGLGEELLLEGLLAFEEDGVGPS